MNTKVEKPYHIDGKAVSVAELLQAAEWEGLDQGSFQLTSEAARYLRTNGHTVGKVEELEVAEWARPTGDMKGPVG